MENQKIGHGEANDQRHSPNNHHVFDRSQIKPEREVRLKEFYIVVENEGWHDLRSTIVEEADNNDQHHRDTEEDQQDESKQDYLEPRRRMLVNFQRGWACW